MADGLQAWLKSRVRIGSKPHKGIASDDVYNLFQQMATLINAGMPLAQGLEMLSVQSQSLSLRRIMVQVTDRVRGGSALYAAMTDHPKVFSPQTIQVIRTGEVSGELGHLLVELANHMKEARASRARIVSALIYPIIIACVAVIAVVIMLWFVVPFFAQFFSETGGKLPRITVFVIGLSKFFQNYGILLVFGCIAGSFGFRAWVRTPDGGRLFVSALMSMPLLGNLLVQSAMERFAMNLALLLRAGMPLLESLYSLSEVFADNAPMRDTLAEIQRRVAAGGSLAPALAESGMFTPMLVNLVAVGEETGELPKVLDHVAEFYKSNVQALVSRVTSMIEPIVILGMGVVVSVILASIYLPMFSMGGGGGK